MAPALAAIAALPPSAGLPQIPSWAAALGAAVFTALLLEGLRRIVTRHLVRLARATDNRLDDLLAEALTRTRPWFVGLVSVAAGSALLSLPPAAGAALRAALVVGIGLQAGLWGVAVAEGLLQQGLGGLADGARRTTLTALRFLVRLALWGGLTLFVLANLGVDVTAVVAGLGVGGVAVALAVQSLLSDLFASLSIVLDRPFEVGDFIIVDDLMGTVEHVGLKTTRLRSLSGEQLVFSNTDLLQARIRNYQRLQERRVVFAIGVTYQTSPADVRRIPELIREAITGVEGTRFDRAHFKSFGDFALLFEAVYFVLNPDYNRYMDVQQRINQALLERFAGDGIQFAYPTQTLFLAKA